MIEINKELKEYIENKIFPIYEQNDSGHDLRHIKYVIGRSLKFSEQFENINLDMVYVVAAFHDLAHHIDKDNHEILSAKLFFDNKEMKRFFNDEQRKIIKEAIEDHRASLKCSPRSDYGKIVSSADRNTDIISALKRTHAYTIKHYPNLSSEQMIERAYKYIENKFGQTGYAKVYVKDDEYDKFKRDAKVILKNKFEFAKIYMELNGIVDIK